MSTPAEERPAGNPPPPGLLSQKDYARRRGWSKQYVNQLVKQGRIPLVNGRIDPVAADEALAGMRDPSRGPKFRGDALAQAAASTSPSLGMDPSPGVQGTFAKARTVREHFRAMREKMEYEAAVGQLVSRQEIEDAAHHAGVLFREHMMRAAEAVGMQVAEQFKIDRNIAVKVVSDGITQALYALADQLRDNEWGFDKGLPRLADADQSSAR